MICLRTLSASALRGCLLFAVCVAIAPFRVLAHGVRYSVAEGASVVVATYDDASPMAFCDVVVFAPASHTESYQEGISDRNGCFAFLPDTNGTWRVTVDDGMGHRVEAEIEIDSDGRLSSEASHPTDRLGGAVVGISIIFGVFGVYAMFAGRGRWGEAGRKAGV